MHCARENQHSRWWRWQRGGNILLGTDFRIFRESEKRAEKDEKKEEEEEEDIILRPEADGRGQGNGGENRREIIS